MMVQDKKRQSSKHPENKERHVLLAILLLGGVFIGKSLGNLIVIPIAQRALTETSFNVWVLLLSLGSYLFIFELGLTQIVMNQTGNSFAKGSLNDISIITTNALIIFISIAIGIIVLFIIAITRLHVDKYIVKDYEEVRNILPIALLIFVPLTIIRLPFRVFASVLNGIRLLYLRLIIDALHPIVLVLSVIFCLSITNDLITLIIVTSTSIFLVFSLFVPVTFKNLPSLRLATSYLSWAVIKKDLLNMMKYAPLPFCFMGQRFLPTFLVSSLGSLSLVPVIYLATMIYRVAIFMTSDSISKGFQPYIISYHAGGHIDKVLTLWNLGTKVSTLLATGLVVLSLGWYDFLARFLLGPDTYLDIRVVIIFAGLCILDSMLSTGVNNLIAMNRYAALSVVWTAELGLAIVLSIIIGMVAGDSSQALCIPAGFLLAKIALSVPAHLILFAKYFKIRVITVLRELFNIRFLTLITGAVVISSLFHHLWPKFTIELRFVYSIAMFVLLSFLFWLFGFTSIERQWLIDRVRHALKSKMLGITISEN